MYTLRLRVKSVKGHCSAGIAEGHSYLVRDPVIVPEGDAPLCLYALPSITAYLTARYRNTPDDDWINGVTELGCPDLKNTVVFGLETVEEERG